MSKKLGVFGVPIESGQSRRGPSDGPDFIRGSNLIGAMEHLGYTVTDYGNMEIEEVKDDFDMYTARFPRTFKENTMKCKTNIEEILSANDCAIVLGGDRTVCTGSILGHSNIDKDLCIVYVGRKPNLQTLMSSTSGHMNEMSLFLMIKEMQSEVPWILDLQDITPRISAKQIGFIGLNDVDNFEKYIINKYGFKAMSVCDIDRLGIEAVVRETLMTVNPDLERPIHLCFNVDVFDPVYGPSAVDSIPGGLTLREAIVIGEFLCQIGNLRVIDILECNPRLKSQKQNDITRSSVIQTILASIGLKRAGTPRIDPDYYAWEKTNLRRITKFKK